MANCKVILTLQEILRILWNDLKKKNLTRNCGFRGSGDEDFYTTTCSPLKLKGRFEGKLRHHIQGRKMSQERNQRESRWQAHTTLYPRTLFKRILLFCRQNAQQCRNTKSLKFIRKCGRFQIFVNESMG
jgi:DNA modification methylase